MSRVEEFSMDYWRTDTIGGLPLTYGQQRLPPKTTHERNIQLVYYSPLERNPSAEPEIEPGTSLSVGNDPSGHLYTCATYN